MTTHNEEIWTRGKKHLETNTSPIASQQEREAARQLFLVKEKAFTRSEA
jgi:hypothetical protein